MENLSILGNKNTENFFIPNIEFNATTGLCEISGESYIEDTFTFYQKLDDWIEEYIRTNQKKLVVNFKLTYFNTASGKGIAELLHTLSKHQKTGREIIVNWYYPEEDVDIFEEAEDLIKETNVKMNLIK